MLSCFLFLMYVNYLADVFFLAKEIFISRRFALRFVMKLISKALRMARVKRLTQFYLKHTRLSTRLSCLYSPAAEHHRTLAGTHFSCHTG